MSPLELGLRSVLLRVLGVAVPSVAARRTVSLVDSCSAGWIYCTRPWLASCTN